MDRALVTRTSLAQDLRAAGVKRGDILLAHISLSKLGFVVGAARTIVEALNDAVGDDGTIVMPSYSGELSDPAEWQSPPVPSDWIDIIREETQAFSEQLTPTRGMGVVPEYFRTAPGTVRSSHPQSSFCACGKHAERITADQHYDYRFGPNSPLGQMRDLGGKAVLIGAPYDTCSFFYLSQFYKEKNREILKSAPVLVGDRKEWVTYKDLEYSYDWFPDAMNALIDANIAQVFQTGEAECVLLSIAESVDFINDWRRKSGR